MMKIAISTQYYNSKNYGGNLQAYALCKYFEKMGYPAQQLSIPLETSPICSLNRSSGIKEIKRKIRVLWRVIFKFVFQRKKRKLKKMKVDPLEALREKEVLYFNQSVVPHSDRVYTMENIKEAIDIYDFFITGSDVVWSPMGYSKALSLEFVPKSVPKCSYAASLGTSFLNEEEKNKFRDFLKDYQGVSVREKSAVSLLKDLSPVPVEHVLDPTLLLSVDDWSSVCSSKIVESKYIFCYFLGKNHKSRQLAVEYATAHNLKIVTIPYADGRYIKSDDEFGDVRLSKVSPADFISLIRYADMVFTDSFHGCVFSFIFKRQFVSLRRDETYQLSTRIYDFWDMLNMPERFCDSDSKERLDYIESIRIIDYSTPFEKYEMLKRNSVEYLKRNIKIAEERINEKNRQFKSN